MFKEIQVIDDCHSYEVTDDCFGSVTGSIETHTEEVISSKLCESWVVLSIYNARKLNVGLNLAAYYVADWYATAFANKDCADRSMYIKHRIAQDKLQQHLISKQFPHIDNYYESALRYLENSKFYNQLSWYSFFNQLKANYNGTPH